MSSSKENGEPDEKRPLLPKVARSPLLPQVVPTSSDTLNCKTDNPLEEGPSSSDASKTSTLCSRNEREAVKRGN